MGLFTPAWMQKDTRRAVAAIERIHDQKKLARVVREAVNDNAVLAAAEKTTDKSCIADRLTTHNTPVDADTVIRLLRLIDDTNDLKKVAMADWSSYRDAPDLREFLDRITAQEDLFDIARNAATIAIRYAAMERITSPSLQMDLYRKAKTPEERLAVLKGCRNDSLFTEALKDKDYKVRFEAIRRIQDHDAFIHWVVVNAVSVPTGWDVFWKKIDELSIEETKKLAEELQKKHSKDVGHKLLLEHICGRLGHISGENCICARCSKELPHDFDGAGICRSCHAHIVEEKETLIEAGVKYAIRTNRKIVYANGDYKWLMPETEMLVDRGTLNWLFPKD